MIWGLSICEVKRLEEFLTTLIQFCGTPVKIPPTKAITKYAHKTLLKDFKNIRGPIKKLRCLGYSLLLLNSPFYLPQWPWEPPPCPHALWQSGSSQLVAAPSCCENWLRRLQWRRDLVLRRCGQIEQTPPGRQCQRFQFHTSVNGTPPKYQCENKKSESRETNDVSADPGMLSKITSHTWK